MPKENAATTVRVDEVVGFVTEEVQEAQTRAEREWRRNTDPDQHFGGFALASVDKSPERLLSDGLKATTVFAVGSRTVGARFPGNDAAIEMIAGDITCAMTNAAQKIDELEKWEVKRESPDYLTLTWENAEE